MIGIDAPVNGDDLASLEVHADVSG